MANAHNRTGILSAMTDAPAPDAGFRAGLEAAAALCEFPSSLDPLSDWDLGWEGGRIALAGDIRALVPTAAPEVSEKESGDE